MHFVDETQKHGFDYRLEMADFRKTLTDRERRELQRDQGGGGGTSGRPSKLSARYFQDTYYADETVRYLREKRDPDKPFILWSSYFMPHTPLVPMQQYFDRYNIPKPSPCPNAATTPLKPALKATSSAPNSGGGTRKQTRELGRALAGYYGNISQMDACIGKVLDTLYDLGLDQNTIIVYTSDHGEMAGAHRMWTKHNMYEQSVCVPLIIRLPGDIGRQHLAQSPRRTRGHLPHTRRIVQLAHSRKHPRTQFLPLCFTTEPISRANTPTPNTIFVTASSRETIDMWANRPSSWSARTAGNSII